jgi:hypothetical protein
MFMTGRVTTVAVAMAVAVLAAGIVASAGAQEAKKPDATPPAKATPAAKDLRSSGSTLDPQDKQPGRGVACGGTPPGCSKDCVACGTTCVPAGTC